MENIKRHYFGSIVILIICEIIYSEAQTSCIIPAIQCGCEQRDNKIIINCRDKRLTQIPLFNNTRIQYDELTFSSAYINISTCRTCNRITSIPPKAFANLKVKRIDLTRNALTDISNDSFAGVEPYLKELLLEGNGTKEPNYAALKNLTGLTTLHLEKFQQTTLNSNNIFRYLQNLESLTLKTIGSLSMIESSAFQNKVPKLKTLWLEDLPLVTYPAGAVLNIPSLQALHFIKTKVQKLYSQSFRDLHSLNWLDLSHNMIDSIDKDTFTGVTDTLLFLNLSHNSLGHNANSRESLIFLSSNNWTNLKELSLGYNKLDTVPDGPFRTMPNLTYLIMESCQLRSISSGLLQGLQNLNTLEVSQNRITDISVNAFVHTPRLTDLLLYQQRKEFIKDALNFPPAAVESIRTSLTHLNLEQNLVNVSQIWEIIKRLTKLKKLRLRSNNLVTVPEFVFRDHTQLQVLDLSENQITSLDQKSFHGLKDTLTSLSLSDNNLATIDECAFNNFSKLNCLYLVGNMWNCDCHLLWLYDWIKSKMITEPGIEYVVGCVCHRPLRLSENNIQAINRSDLTCIPAYTPYRCPDYYITRTITTTITAKTPKPLPVFNIFITESLIFSITISWTINDKNDVTGYVLSIADSQNNSSKSLTNLHKDDTVFKFKGLQPQRAYNICLQVELNHVSNQSLISCVTQSTKTVPAF